MILFISKFCLSLKLTSFKSPFLIKELIYKGKYLILKGRINC